MAIFVIIKKGKRCILYDGFEKVEHAIHKMSWLGFSENDYLLSDYSGLQGFKFENHESRMTYATSVQKHGYKLNDQEKKLLRRAPTTCQTIQTKSPASFSIDEIF